MLHTLHNLLSTFLIPGSIELHPESALQLATAVLLIEVMQADAESATEQVTILGILKKRFALAEAEVKQLTERGLRAAKSTSDFEQFAEVINRNLELPEKIRLVEYMWQVAYVDGKISTHEDHLIHKAAELLHILPEDNIVAKTRARFPDLR